MLYFGIKFCFLTFWQISSATLQYETVTCEGDDIQKVHKVRENTVTYFQSKNFPHNAMSSDNSSSSICNILFETEAGMKLLMLLYNGKLNDYTINDGLNHYTTKGPPLSNMRPQSFLTIHQNMSFKAFYSSGWTAFEGVIVSFNSLHHCLYQDEIIPLEEGKIIPFMSNIYPTPQTCIINFKLKNPGKNVKFVYSKIEKKFFEYAKKYFTTVYPSRIKYRETNEEGYYRLTMDNSKNVNYIGHHSVSDINYKYQTKRCNYEKFENLVIVSNVNYNAYERCEYDIIVPENYIIELTVNFFQMEFYADLLWLEDVNGKKIKEITAYESHNFTDDAKLIFQSDGSIQQLGFSLNLKNIIVTKNTLSIPSISKRDITTAAIVAFFIISLFVACCGVSCWFYKKKKYEKIETESADIKHLYKKYLIPMEKIKQCDKVGTGASADVYLATYKTRRNLIKVAVKILKNEEFSKSDILREMKLLSSCKHKNVVEFIGFIEKEEEQISIVTEFMGGGELHAYLLNSNKLLLVSTVFSYIFQVLDAMTYLSHKHILHRDLAARNCLLNGTYEILKINDFGLARETDVNYEYISEANPKLPFRWLPLEALQPPPQHFKTFTYKGDIWSFGILIWEMFERSDILYNNMGPRDLIQFLKRGERLPCPYHCPLELYSLMLECWDERPEKRPIFDDLQIQIQNIFLEMKTQNPNALNVPIEIGSGYEHPNN